MRFRLISFALASFSAAVAHANLFVNSSFEDGAFVPNGDNAMSLGVGDTTITGWEVYSEVIAWISDPNPFNGLTASNGIRSLDLTDYAGGYGGIHQTINTVIGETYTVEFDLGANSAYGDAALAVNTGSGEVGYTLHSENGQVWKRISLQFVANASLTQIGFTHDFDGGNYTGLDNVSVTGTVPEPATMALLALAPLAMRRRRK